LGKKDYSDYTKMNLIFVLIGERDAQYFYNLALFLKKYFANISFISFNDSAKRIIKQERNIKLINLSYKNVDYSHQYSLIETNYKISLDDVIRHDLVTFKSSKKFLKNKFIHYFLTLDSILDSQKNNYVFQEIGGYIANLSVFYQCKNKNINHVFLEPSFFPGRVHALINSIDPVNPKLIKPVSVCVKKHLETCQEMKLLSFSSKDKLHYSHPIKKFFLIGNWTALLTKLLNIYVKKNYVEHQFWKSHIKRYAGYAFNSTYSFIFNFYKKLNQVDQDKAIYFPLHVPEDFQLTTRCPEFYDQIKILRTLLSIKPKNVALITKEHPAMKGSFPSRQTKDLFQRKDFYLIQPEINNFDIIKFSELIITINSKTGFEALLSNKKVICLSKSFYSNSGLTINLSLAELSKSINRIIPTEEIDQSEKVLHLAQGIYNLSYPMSLYDNSELNILNSVETVIQIMKNENFIPNQ